MEAVGRVGEMVAGETCVRRVVRSPGGGAGEFTARRPDRVSRAAWALAGPAGCDRPDRGDVKAALFFHNRRAA